MGPKYDRYKWSEIYIYIWVFPKIGGKPPKWMVKIMEKPIKMDDLGGPPLFFETPIYRYTYTRQNLGPLLKAKVLVAYI